MTRARHTRVDYATTTHYHCINRCVRRAFLCGEDFVTGKSFEHRRGWIEERLKELVSIFSIDLAAYAIMSNHLHLVVSVDLPRAAAWSDEEVITRWTTLFPGCKTQVTAVTDEVLAAKVAEWRERLTSISWFMRSASGPIASMANAEDKVTGRFWEGRFKCQALLDEGALLACMAYVDLNSVRAGEAKSIEASKHTSGRARVKQLKSAQEEVASARGRKGPKKRLTKKNATPKHLLAMPLSEKARHEKHKRGAKDLPISLPEYLNLLRWTARQTKDHIAITESANKSEGVVALIVKPPAKIAATIAKCGLKPELFAQSAMLFHELTYVAVGSAASMNEAREKREVAHLHGARKTTGLYLAA